MEYEEKKPLGVMPKWCHNEHRMIELLEAIDRRIHTDRFYEIPIEWVIEYNELVKLTHEGKRHDSEINKNIIKERRM